MAPRRGAIQHRAQPGPDLMEVKSLADMANDLSRGLAVFAARLTKMERRARGRLKQSRAAAAQGEAASQGR